MATAQLDLVLRHIHRLAGPGSLDDPSDSQLLERFIARHDEAAFTLLLRRHGALVLGVCRRLLHNEHDAEDAFQATFLVLARKAASIRRREALGGWLYEVAYHIAVRARAAVLRRRANERRVPPMADTDPMAALAWRELRPLLDEELTRLPEKYRLPILLCYLEGKTNEQAARQLGWTKGTVSGRLARARDLLRRRLARRGLVLGAGLLATLLGRQAAAAAVPPALLSTSLEGSLLFITGNIATARVVSPPALALAEGMLKTMVGIKLRFLTALFLGLGLLTTGTGVFFHQVLAEGEGGQQPATPEGRDKPTGARAAGTDAAGDLLPPGAIQRLGSARLHHGHGVMGMAFSPDGKTLVSAGHDHLARLWDVATGREIRDFGDPALRQNPYERSRWQFSVAFSPDGKILAVGEHAPGWQVSTIRLWDVDTGKELRKLEGHQNGVLSLAFSPDGKTLASGSVDEMIGLWEVETGKQQLLIPAHQDQVRYVAFLDNGQTLVAGGANGSVRFWEAGNGQPVTKPGGPLEDVETVAASPDGKVLALGGGTGVIRLWDIAAGKQLRKLEGHTDAIKSLSFAADGKTLASGSADRTVRLWELASGKSLQAFPPHQGLVHAVAVAPGGKAVASSAPTENVVHLWEAATGKDLHPTTGHLGRVGLLSYSADGKLLFSAGRDRSMRQWDPATGKELRLTFGQHNTDPAVTVAPDGRAAWGGTDGVIHLLELGSGNELRQLKGHTQGVKALAFSPDGSNLVSAAADGTLRAWETATGRELRQQATPGVEGIQYLEYSPDGKTVAWGASDMVTHLWDAAKGNEVRQFAEHKSRIMRAAFSPDGKLLATGGQDGRAYVWDVASGKNLHEVEGHPGYVMSLAFSPDSRTLAVGSWMSIRLWELATGKERGRLLGQDGDLFALAFAPDGRTLASGGGDSTILIWDLTERLRDGRLQTVELAPPNLESVWLDLSGDNATRAYRAIWALTAAPKQAVPLLRDFLKPTAAVDATRVAQLVKDLDNDDFDTREKATKELEVLGKAVEATLRKALEGAPSAEVRRRAEGLLEKLTTGSSADRARVQRALEVLEQIASPEAKQLLAALAKGEAAAPLTQDAKAVLARLARRATAKP